MVSSLIYPTYTNFYYYEEGDDYIYLKRTNNAYGGKAIFTTYIEFDSPAEALEYFINECGD